MSGEPIVTAHVEDPARPGFRLCDGAPFQPLPPELAAGRTSVHSRCRDVVRARGRALVARSTRPVAEVRDQHPLVAQLLAGMEPQMAALTQATVDAAVLGDGWIRIRLCPVHGTELERIDPSRVIVADPS